MGSVGINFGSATSGTGFDVSAVVSSIVANLQKVETPWNTQLTALKADNTALTSIGTDLASLSSSLQTLTDFQGVMAQKEGASSDTSILTLTGASASASAGNHTVVVSQLAQTASAYSDAIPASDTISGALTIQVGIGSTATTHTIPVVSGVSDNLASYAAAINAADIGVSASVITDTTGARLSLVSKTPGAAGALTVTQGGSVPDANTQTRLASSITSTATVAATNTFAFDAPTDKLSGTLSYAVGSGSTATVDLGSTPLSLSDAVAAMNADVGFSSAGLTATIDGSSLIITGSTGDSGSASIDTTGSTLTTTTAGSAYAALSDITTPKNILNINTGLSAQDALLSVDGASVDSASNTLTTAIPGVTFQLLSASKTPVQVEIVNDSTDVASAFSTFVSAYNKVLGDLSAQEGNDSSGNPEPLYGNPIVAQLQSALSLALTTGTASGSIKSLAQLGITVGNTGALTLNSSTLGSALNSNYSDVVGFLQNPGSFGQTLSSTLGGLGNTTPSGAIALAISTYSSQETTLNDDVTAQNKLIAKQQADLTAELNAANETLQAIPQQLNEINELYSAMTGYNTNTSG